MAQILLIDDNEQLRGVVQEMLTRAGYEVFGASNGIVGIELYRDKRPDLVITDVLMPDMDGAEVVFELKKEFPDIKIIVMSGGGMGDAQDYLDSIKLYSDIKHTFKKPFAMEDLLKAVKEEVG